MNFRSIAGVLSVSALMLFAMLAGSLLLRTAGANAPVAQTGLLAQTAQATATAVPATPAPGTPKPGAPSGPGFRGRGFGHHGGGPGLGHHGEQYTAEGASRVISSTTEFITLVKSDLAYANGKMDTATVQDWVNRADGLLRTAQTAANGSQYERAVATASAAKDLAWAADILMQQALGADKLPSYSQRPFPGPGKGRPGPGPGTGTGTTTVPTQAQASRELLGLYNSIVAKDAQLKSVSNAGDASTYLTAAKNNYRTAHTAYQAGNYPNAHNAAVVAHTLLHVVEDLIRAATATNSPDTPVTVPAPNF